MINYVRTGIPGTQWAFSGKVTPDIDGFTDKPVVQCDVQFYRWFRINDTNDRLIQIIPNRF